MRGAAAFDNEYSYNINLENLGGVKASAKHNQIYTEVVEEETEDQYHGSQTRKGGKWDAASPP